MRLLSGFNLHQSKAINKSEQEKFGRSFARTIRASKNSRPSSRCSKRLVCLKEVRLDLESPWAHRAIDFGLSPRQVQFQQDRLLHNWRKIGYQTNEYHRFEKIISTFESEIHLVNNYFVTLAGKPAAINQCEISYINHIPLEGKAHKTNAVDWLRFIQFKGSEPEDFSIVFRKTIQALDGRPQGRLTTEAVLVIDVKGQEIIVLTLTARGAPVDQTSDSALEFLKLGREIIVRSFADITTDSAHTFWERVQ